MTIPNQTLIQCQADVKEIISPIYKGVIIGEVIAAALALGPNIFLMSVVYKISVFPANLRLLLAHFSFVLAWLSVGAIIKDAYVLSTPYCSFEMSQLACRIFDLATTNMALPILLYSLMALCVERLFATITYRRYEKNKWHTKPYLACALIIVAVSTAFGMNGSGAFGLPNNKYVPICESNFMPSASASPYTSQIYLSLECAATAVTMFIYFYNRCVAKHMAINRAVYNLSSRFLIDQNVKINSIVVPSMTLHFLVHIPSFTLSNISKELQLDTPTKAWVSRTTILLRLVYGIMHPMLAFYFNTHLRQQALAHSPVFRLLRYFGFMEIVDEKSKNENSRPHVNNLAAHFDQLDKAWSLMKPSAIGSKRRSSRIKETPEVEQPTKGTKF